MQVLSLEALNEEVSKIDDWRTSSPEQAANLLYGLGARTLGKIVKTALNNLQDFPFIERGSAQKPTHYKLFLGGDPHKSYAIWAHFYGRGSGPAGCGLYAERFHNHGYSFASEQIGRTDAYTEDLISPSGSYALTDAGLYAPEGVAIDPNNADEVELRSNSYWQPSAEDWQPKTHTFRTGEVVVRRGNVDIHRVYNAGRAVTLLIQGPRERHVSQTFDEHGLISGQYPDMLLQTYDLSATI